MFAFTSGRYRPYSCPVARYQCPGAVVLTVLFWFAVNHVSPSISTQAGWMGIFVVFGQAVDAISTAVGVNVLSVSEQVPLSRAVLELAATLPTAPVSGS